MKVVVDTSPTVVCFDRRTDLECVSALRLRAPGPICLGRLGGRVDSALAELAALAAEVPTTPRPRELAGRPAGNVVDSAAERAKRR